MPTYTPESLGVKRPEGGFQTGGWYGGRQYWEGTLGEAGAIHQSSNQQGAGQAVSQEVRGQSAQQQGVSLPQFNQYIEGQAQQGAGVAPASPPPSSQPQQGQVSQASQATSGATGQPDIQPQADFNLPELYQDLYKSSGISDIEEEFSQKEKAFIEAKGKINDNPFLSEATRVGRVAKLESLFTERTANLQRDIATKKADIETRLNLESKQFDIESEVAQQGLSRLNTLLSMGALDNASGDTIASLTRSTGISSELIISAIDAGKKSKKKEANTKVITSTAENGEMFAVVINADTGDIIKRSSLGVIGNVQTGSGGDGGEDIKEVQSQMVSAMENRKNDYGHIAPQDWQQALASWISRGGDADDFVKNFKQYADPNREDFDQVYYERK